MMPEDEWQYDDRGTVDEWDSNDVARDVWSGEGGQNTQDSANTGFNSFADKEGNGAPLEVFSSTDDFQQMPPESFTREYNKEFEQPGEIQVIGVGYGQNLKKMSREAWGAERPLPRPMLSSPATKVRFTYTGTPLCNTNEECMAACRQIQKYYMDLGFADIPYNFLIGNDGILYHGRGWQKQADRPPTFNSLRKSCVDVAYIGNFETEVIPYSMLAIGTDFLKYGLKIGKITPFYHSYSFVGPKNV